MRRSRITVRPNVRPGNRSLATSQAGLPAQGSANDSQDGESSAQTSARAPDGTGAQNHIGDQKAQAENNACVTPGNTNGSQQEKKTSPDLSGKGQNGEQVDNGSLPSSSWQKRKRFSAMPNLSRTRVTPTLIPMASRTPRSPAMKRITVPTPGKTAVNSEDHQRLSGSASKGLRSPNRRRTYSGEKQLKLQGKSGPLSPMAQEPGASPQAKKPAVKPLSHQCSEELKNSKEAVSHHGDNLPSQPSTAGGKPSQGVGPSVKSLPSSSTLAPRTQSSPSDREKLLKAQKLRELLKRDWKKKKKRRKAKWHTSENGVQQDHNKMTMGDLIYYLPETNPMKSYLAEESKLAGKVTSPTPAKMPTDTHQELEEEEDVVEENVGNEDEEQNGQDEQLVAPRVKVAEDGSLIIDEESLTVEVCVKGPNTVEENDPIFERGSSTTYSSFRKGHYTKPWSSRETDMFFLAISMVGTDFSMIGQLFPHRGRSEIKNKFKREERTNSWRIDKAFVDKRRLDLKTFKRLLEEILTEEERKQQKMKAKGSEEKVSRRPRKKRKPRMKGAPKWTPEAIIEEEMDGEEAGVNLETAEKENEDCTNVAETWDETSSPLRKQLKKSEEKEHPSSVKPGDGRRPRSSTSGAEDAAMWDSTDVATDTLASDDKVQRIESTAEGWREAVIKPAQLRRGQVTKPAPNLRKQLGRRVSDLKKQSITTDKTAYEVDKGHSAPEPGSDVGDVAAGKPLKGERLPGDGASPEDEEQASDVETEAELTAVQEQLLNRPTRSGRVPKLSLALQQAEQEVSSEEPVPTSSSAPRGKESSQIQRRQPTGVGKRPKPNLNMARRSKLVTLRVSLPEDGKYEEKQSKVPQPVEPYSYPINPEEQNQAPAFVPLGLRSPEPVSLEVEETVEEFEISDNTPGTFHSTEAEVTLCPPAEFQEVQEELAAPEEHQLDLLVDVVEFLPADHAEEVSVSDESYNEAARTLLTIRNPGLLSPRTSVCCTEKETAQSEETFPLAQGEAGLGSKAMSEQAEEIQLCTAPSSTLTSDFPSHNCSRTEQESLIQSDAAPGPPSTRGLLLKMPPAAESHSEKRLLDSARKAPEASAEPEPVGHAQPAERRRFLTPKPNLRRMARASRVQQTQSAKATASENKETLALPPKNTEVESDDDDDDDDAVSKETALEESKSKGAGVEKLRQSRTSASRCSDNSTGISQKRTLGSEALVPIGPQSRRSRFPKPKPNLGCATRNPRLAATQSSEAHVTADDGGPTEREGTEETRVDVQARVPTAETWGVEKEDRAESLVTLVASSVSAGEGLSRSPANGSAVQSKENMTVAAVSNSTTEGVSVEPADFTQTEPTIILTLFEVPPAPASEYELKSDSVPEYELESDTVPGGTVAAELISPLVFIDTPSGPGGDFMVGETLAPALQQQTEDTGLGSRGHTCGPSEGFKEQEVETLHELCDEEHLSLSLVPVEESCEVQQETTEVESEDTGPPRKKRKMTTKREGLPRVKPNPLKKAHVQSTEDDRNDFPKESALPLPTRKVSQEVQSNVPGASLRSNAVEDQTIPKAGCQDPPQQVVDTPLQKDGCQGGDSQHRLSTPLAISGHLTRPGRKPKGFLSFISNKSAAGPSGAPRTARSGPQRPLLNTCRAERRRTSPSTVSTDVSSAHCKPVSAASPALTMERSEVPKLRDEEKACVKPSDDKAECTEPTGVSKYFFSDIFTEVEEII